MRALSLGFVIAAMLAVGCSADPDPVGGTGGLGGASGFGGAGGVSGFGGVGGASGAGGGACVTFETQPCTCAGAMGTTVSGRMVCSTGIWSTCLCDMAGGGAGGTGGAGGGGMATEPLANKNPNVMWDWTESAPMGMCRAGQYKGTFDGFYASPIIAGFPVPIVGGSADPANPGGLQFTLEEGGAGEILMITGGKMTGTVYGFIPFECDITGSLNCGTNRFEGMLENGWYEVFGARFNFAGPITADYDPVAGTMVNGFWRVKEPNQQPPEPLGGEGHWNAAFAP